MDISIPEGCPSVDEIVNAYQTNKELPDTIELGRGAFGRVLRHRDWVIKIVEIKSPKYKELFNSEVKTLVDLSKHKDLRDYMPKYCWSAISSTEDMGLIIQMYEPVMTLFDVLHVEGTLSAENTYTYMKNLIKGFELLHKAGYVHRDIKPLNILVRTEKGPNEFVPIIIDFGYACRRPCADRRLKGTPGYVPMNWISNKEGNGSIKGFRRHNIYLSHQPTKTIVKPNAKTGIQRPHALYNLSYEHGISANATLRKKIKTQPYAMSPEYTELSDKYALYITLDQLFFKVDWRGHETLRDEIDTQMQKFRDQMVFDLAAQYAVDSRPYFQEGRMKKLAALNLEREARMKNLVRENAEARRLAEMATAKPNKNTRKRKRANNRQEPQTRRRPKCALPS